MKKNITEQQCELYHNGHKYPDGKLYDENDNIIKVKPEWKENDNAYTAFLRSCFKRCSICNKRKRVGNWDTEFFWWMPE